MRYWTGTVPNSCPESPIPSVWQSRVLIPHSEQWHFEDARCGANIIFPPQPSTPSHPSSSPLPTPSWAQTEPGPQGALHGILGQHFPLLTHLPSFSQMVPTASWTRVFYSHLAHVCPGISCMLVLSLHRHFCSIVDLCEFSASLFIVLFSLSNALNISVSVSLSLYHKHTHSHSSYTQTFAHMYTLQS